MAKTTKKKTKEKYLEQQEKHVQGFVGIPVSFANMDNLCKSRQEFLQRLKNDKLDHLLNLRNIHSNQEISLLLAIQKILFSYDVLISEMDRELTSTGYEHFMEKDDHINEVLSSYM